MRRILITIILVLVISTNLIYSKHNINFINNKFIFGFISLTSNDSYSELSHFKILQSSNLIKLYDDHIEVLVPPRKANGIKYVHKVKPPFEVYYKQVPGTTSVEMCWFSIVTYEYQTHRENYRLGFNPWSSTHWGIQRTYPSTNWYGGLSSVPVYSFKIIVTKNSISYYYIDSGKQTMIKSVNTQSFSFVDVTLYGYNNDYSKTYTTNIYYVIIEPKPTIVLSSF